MVNEHKFRAYHSPTLSKYGSITELTQGNFLFSNSKDNAAAGGAGGSDSSTDFANSKKTQGL